MINHARTLLLNDCAVTNITVAGEEYIQEDFSPVLLTPYLLKIHNVLFGINASRDIKNYRLCQLLTIIHNTPLHHFITDFDNRITYLPIMPSNSIDKDLIPINKLIIELTPIVLENIHLLFSDKQPYAEFKTYWDSSQFVYKLSGILLAVIYRIEELRS